MDRRERRSSELLLELRPSRLPPRYQPRVFAGSQGPAGPAVLFAGRAARAGGLHPQQPGHHRSGEHECDLLHQPRDNRAEALALAFSDLPRGRGHHGRAGEIVGSCFHHLPRLEAYRLDLIGSLIGIAAFTLLSFAGAPSVVWGAIVATLYAVLLGRPGRGIAIAAAAGLVMLLAGETFIAPGTTGESVSWSPYYKVTTYDQNEGETSSLMVRVNGIPHQRVTAAAVREQQEPQYVTAYQRLVDNPLDNVLIVGAGTGTDVAIALRKGAKHVDAVEIDPALLQLGRDRNPDRPYQ